MTPSYQYVIVHQSCRNHLGVLACQAAHAASEAIRSLPVSPETVVCVLVAEKSADLEALSGVLALAEIEHVLIREPDPPYNGAATALGIEPGDRDRVRELVKPFKILR